MAAILVRMTVTPYAAGALTLYRAPYRNPLSRDSGELHVVMQVALADSPGDPVTFRLDSVSICPMTYSNGNSFGTKSTERECPLIRRLLQVTEDRR